MNGRNEIHFDGLEHGGSALGITTVGRAFRLFLSFELHSDRHFHDSALLNVRVHHETTSAALVLALEFLLRLQHLYLRVKMIRGTNHARANHRAAELHQTTEIVASNHPHTRLVEFWNRGNVVESALTQFLPHKVLARFFILNTVNERLLRLHDGSVHQRHGLNGSVQNFISQRWIDRKQLLDAVHENHYANANLM